MQLVVTSIEQILGVRVLMDSLQHEPTVKYTELIHLMITKFTLFHLFGSFDFQVPNPDAIVCDSFGNQRVLFAYWKLKFSCSTV